MKKHSVRLYQSEDYSLWNDFIGQAKNATFLFHRDFMEYHADRFEDYSLLVFNENNNLVALMPAHLVGSEVFSHNGLTYGSIVYNQKSKAQQCFDYFDSIVDFLKLNQITSLSIKPIPILYDKNLSSLIDFQLFNKGAKLLRKDMCLFLNFDELNLISKSKLKKFRKFSEMGMQMREEKSFESFWNQILIPRLESKYSKKPVHTLAEISSLANFFPNNIKQYNAYYEDEIIAGITIFEDLRIVKSQYGATSTQGESLRALDFLFISLIYKYAELNKQFFDMGTVTDSNFTNGYNSGLLNQKEELGCIISEQNHYRLNLNQND